MVTVKNGSTTLPAADYDYDTAGRLWKVREGNPEAVYRYHPNSSLIAILAQTNGPGRA
mgnify:CR=1 FL=1